MTKQKCPKCAASADRLYDTVWKCQRCQHEWDDANPLCGGVKCLTGKVQ